MKAVTPGAVRAVARVVMKNDRLNFAVVGPYRDEKIFKKIVKLKWKKQSLEISWASLWRIAIFLAFATVIYLGHQIVLGLFLAIVISSGFEGIVDNIERRLHLPRSLGVVLLFLRRDACHSFIPLCRGAVRHC